MNKAPKPKKPNIYARIGVVPLDTAIAHTEEQLRTSAQDALKQKEAELARTQLSLTQLQHELNATRSDLEGQLATTHTELNTLKRSLETATAERDSARTEHARLEELLTRAHTLNAALVEKTNNLIDVMTAVITTLPPAQLTPELEAHMREVIAHIETLENQA